MKRSVLIAVVVLGLSDTNLAQRGPAPAAAPAAKAAAPAASQAKLPMVEVYFGSGCGCCRRWVEHMKANGFTVQTIANEKLDEFRVAQKIPRPVWGCHTAKVGNYLVEGHVSASDVKKLLNEKPAIAGLAVAGMPLGSAGMEAQGVRPQPYTVMAFGKDGKTSVYASYGR
jgi:hypothetical protein